MAAVQSRDQQDRTALAGTIGVAGVAIWVLIVLALHGIKSDMDPIDIYISDYAIGDNGWLMQTAFFAVGLGTIAIGYGYWLVLDSTKRARAAIALTIVAGLGFIVAGAFVGDATGITDLTTSGILHLVGALMALPTLAVGAFFYRGAFNRTPGWEPVGARIRWLPYVLLVAFLISFFTPEGGAVGLTQRIFAAILMAWLALLALQLRSAGTRD